jgi:hypothetical protein
VTDYGLNDRGLIPGGEILSSLPRSGNNVSFPKVVKMVKKPKHEALPLLSSAEVKNALSFTLE